MITLANRQHQASLMIVAPAGGRSDMGYRVLRSVGGLRAVPWRAMITTGNLRGSQKCQFTPGRHNRPKKAVIYLLRKRYLTT